MDLFVKDSFKTLIPPLTTEERNDLERSLIEYGCRDALVVWRTRDENGDTFDFLIDGHNRYEICEARGIEYKVHPMSFDDETDVKSWIIQNQLARRNLDNVQKARMALLLKGVTAEKAKEKQRASGGAVPQKSAKPVIDTRKELARIAGISHDTINKVEAVDTHAPEPIKQAMTDKLISINKAYERTKNFQDMPKEEKESYTEAIEQYPILTQATEKVAIEIAEIASKNPEEIRWEVAKRRLDEHLKNKKNDTGNKAYGAFTSALSGIHALDVSEDNVALFVASEHMRMFTNGIDAISRIDTILNDVDFAIEKLESLKDALWESKKLRVI